MLLKLAACLSGHEMRTPGPGSSPGAHPSTAPLTVISRHRRHHPEPGHSLSHVPWSSSGTMGTSADNIKSLKLNSFFSLQISGADAICWIE